MIRNILITLTIVVFAVGVRAEPGGTYTLTGNEKNLAEIIKADMAAHPSLYKGENYNSYLTKFKSENKIGKRKLKPGDQLQFPETLASLKNKKKGSASGVQSKPIIVIYVREYHIQEEEVVSEEFWGVIQKKINEAGYKTEVRFSDDELVDGDNFLCFSFYLRWVSATDYWIQQIGGVPVNGGIPLNGLSPFVRYNENNSESKEMARVLNRCVKRRCSEYCELVPIDDSEMIDGADKKVKNPYPKMLFQDVPSVIIGLSPDRASELREEYAQAILETINDYLD